MEVIVLLKKKKGDKIMTKRFGFTLAEVLITLGIIGVVAAMTIPTLIANTNSAKFRSQYKKTLSSLNQAALMAQAQYDVDYSAARDMGDAYADENAISQQNVETNTGTTSLAAIFQGTLSAPSITKAYPYANTSEPVGPADTVASLTVGSADASTKTLNKPLYLSLADGSMVFFSGSASGCTKPVGTAISAWANDADNVNCLGYIDVNGATRPNKEVNCGGTSGGIAEGVSDCVVSKSASDMTDIYPIAFHDGTVEPITKAARYVLTTSK